MIDQRLMVLRQAGYSLAQVEKFVESFPESFLRDLERVDTPHDARILAREYLADAKASIEGF